MMPRVTSLGSTSFRRYSIAASRAYSSDGKQTPPATPSHPHPSQSYLGPDAGDHRTPVKARTSNVAEHVFIAARNRADALTASAMASISRLGFQLNRITGYEDIETLKERVSQNELKLRVARQAAREAKDRYAVAVIQRSNSQREVNDLLQRKSTWTESDIGRFTTLVRLDHSHEQEEAKAKAVMDETDNTVEKEFNELMRSILARYHEEQVWSDKIRSASTYGSLAVLGLNLFVFVMAIVVVEPWKRKKMTMAFEKKVKDMGAETREALEVTAATLERKLEDHKSQLDDIVSKSNSSWAERPQVVEVSRFTQQGWGVAIATSAVLAGAVGWFARGWLGGGMQ